MDTRIRSRAGIGIAVLALVSTVTAAGSTATWSNPISAAYAQSAPGQLTVPVYARKYQLGLGYVRGIRSPTLTLEQAISTIAFAADIAYIQRGWNDWLPATTAYDPEIQLAKQMGLKTHLSLDLLGYSNPPRSTVDVPASFGISGAASLPGSRYKNWPVVTPLTTSS